MKACFVGAHGTGKSTLARQLFSIFEPTFSNKPFSLIDGTSTLFLEYSGVDCKDPHYEDLLIMYRIIMFTGHEHFISDRSLVDPLAYQRYKQGLNTKFMTDLCHNYSQELILFYLPPSIPLIGEGHRPTDVVYQRAVDREICYLLKSSFYKKLYTVDVQGIEQRIEFIHNILQQELLEEGIIK